MAAGRAAREAEAQHRARLAAEEAAADAREAARAAAELAAHREAEAAKQRVVAHEALRKEGAQRSSLRELFAARQDARKRALAEAARRSGGVGGR